MHGCVCEREISRQLIRASFAYCGRHDRLGSCFKQQLLSDDSLSQIMRLVAGQCYIVTTVFLCGSTLADFASPRCRR